MTPPTELSWDTPLSELITTIYDLSEELLANPPRIRFHCLRCGADIRDDYLIEAEDGSTCYDADGILTQWFGGIRLCSWCEHMSAPEKNEELGNNL